MLRLFSLLSLFLLLPLPAWASPVPASCIPSEPLPSTAPRQPHWQSFLPVLVLGVDHRPDLRIYSQTQTALTGSQPISSPPGELANHSHRDTMTRFTAGLRWNSPPPSSRPSLPGNQGLAERCRRYLELNHFRPRSLREAIDHWARTSSLEALLLQGGTPQ